MSVVSAVAVGERREYPSRMRVGLRLLLLLCVAMLPLTSFAARAGAAADLTSSAAVELEQGALPIPGQTTAPAQEHRHCTHWAADAATCLRLAADLSAPLPVDPFGFGTHGAKMAGPEASTPPPKA